MSLPTPDEIYKRLLKIELSGALQPNAIEARFYRIEFKGSENTNPLLLPYCYEPSSGIFENILADCDHQWETITAPFLSPVVYQCQHCKGKATFHVWEGV